MPHTGSRFSGRHLNSCSDAQDEGRFSVDVLGPLRVAGTDGDATLTSRQQRALLALLAINANTPVATDRLTDQLWNGAPPPKALTTLRSYISHIRRFLEQHTRGQARIATTDGGYRLDIALECLDLTRFRTAVATGHDHLRSAQPEQALHAFAAALAMWRSDPLAEIADREAAIALVAELKELRTEAIEGRLRALVDMGRPLEAVSGLEQLSAAEPFRERPRELLMIALHRSGRSPEALDVHRRFRSLLHEELGIEPSSRLDRLVEAILNRDPRLEAVASAPTPVATASDRSSAELMVTLIETLRTVSDQLDVVIHALCGQVSGEIEGFAYAADLVAALTERSPASGNAAIAS